MRVIGTKEAARLLRVSVSRLHQAAWLERFPAPEKVNGGYVWGLEDLRRAHKVLHGIPLELSMLPPDVRELLGEPDVLAMTLGSRIIA